MALSDTYREKYEAYIPVLQGIAAEGDTSGLQGEMKKRADYNKGILDAMAGNQNKKEQIEDSYRWVNNPAFEGYTINDRDRLKSADLAGVKQEGNALGAYYTARQEDLASAITAWKDAWQAKYNASKEGAQGAKDLFGMAFDKEKQEESIRQFNENQALERWKEQQANSRNAASIAATRENSKKASTVFDQIDTAINKGMGWGDVSKLLENNGYKVTQGSDADMYLRYRYIGPTQLQSSGETKTLQRMYDLGLAKSAYGGSTAY